MIPTWWVMIPPPHGARGRLEGRPWPSLAGRVFVAVCLQPLQLGPRVTAPCVRMASRPFSPARRSAFRQGVRGVQEMGLCLVSVLL